MKLIRDDIEGIVTEFIGTFLIVFLPCLTTMKVDLDEPTNPGVSLFLLYAFLSYSNMRFSQAHFNPAVTLSYFTTKEISLMKMITYLIAQFGASFLAGFLLLFFRGGFTGGTLGMPWMSKFKNTDQYVVHPFQGRISYNQRSASRYSLLSSLCT